GWLGPGGRCSLPSEEPGRYGGSLSPFRPTKSKVLPVRGGGHDVRGSTGLGAEQRQPGTVRVRAATDTSGRRRCGPTRPAGVLRHAASAARGPASAAGGPATTAGTARFTAATARPAGCSALRAGVAVRHRHGATGR